MTFQAEEPVAPRPFVVFFRNDHGDGSERRSHEAEALLRPAASGGSGRACSPRYRTVFRPRASSATAEPGTMRPKRARGGIRPAGAGLRTLERARSTLPSACGKQLIIMILMTFSKHGPKKAAECRKIPLDRVDSGKGRPLYSGHRRRRCGHFGVAARPFGVSVERGACFARPERVGIETRVLGAGRKGRAIALRCLTIEEEERETQAAVFLRGCRKIS